MRNAQGMRNRSSTSTRLAAAFVSAVLTLAVVTSETGAASVIASVPGDEWETTTPEAAGMDEAVLDDIASDAASRGSDCMVVVRDGRIVAEWAWNGSDPGAPREVVSVAKSITSTLVGIAAADGDLELEQPAADYIAEWQGTESEPVRIVDLLSNTSGREWSDQLDNAEFPAAQDRTAFAVGLGQTHQPGDVWAYNNAAIQTLSVVLHSATGQQPSDYADQRLFEAIGMDDTTMAGDQAGNTMMPWLLTSTCRDLARFGLLHLNGGSWAGEQIVPESFIDAATSPSSDLNVAYGYLWWLNRSGPINVDLSRSVARGTGGADEGPLVPDAPDDMFWAWGIGGQLIQVDPGTRTVAVRLGAFDSDYLHGDLARIATDAVTS